MKHECSVPVYGATGSEIRSARRRALIAMPASLMLLLGGTSGLSALFARLNPIANLSADSGSCALALALTLACAALIALIPSSRGRSGIAASSADEMKPGRAPSLPAGATPAHSPERAVSWMPAFGALAACAELGLFLLTGSARVSHGRTAASFSGIWLTLWLEAGLALYPTLWIRGALALFEPAHSSRLRRLFPLAGAALVAGWLLFTRNCTAWTFVLNAFLLGGQLSVLMRRPRGWLPAAAGVFSFFAASHLFGETAAVYPVSEPFLTGAEAGGLFGSPVLTIFLLLWALTPLAKCARMAARKIPNDPTESGGRLP